MTIKYLLIIIFCSIIQIVRCQDSILYYGGNHGSDMLFVRNDTVLILCSDGGRSGWNVFRGILKNDTVTSIPFVGQPLRSYFSNIKRYKTDRSKFKLTKTIFDLSQDTLGIQSNKSLDFMFSYLDKNKIRHYCGLNPKIDCGRLVAEINDSNYVDGKVCVYLPMDTFSAEEVKIDQREMVEAELHIYPNLKYIDLKQIVVHQLEGTINVEIPFKLRSGRYDKLKNNELSCCVVPFKLSFMNNNPLVLNKNVYNHLIRVH
jgi:hypothetical protein